MENSVKQLQDDLKKRDVKIKLLEDNFDKLEDSINKSQGHCKKTTERIVEIDKKLKKIDEKQENLEKVITQIEEITNSNIVAEKQNLKCDECKFVTESESGLKVHKQRKHKKLDYPPYDCEFGT